MNNIDLQNKIFKFLKDREAINIKKIEEESSLPKGTLAHFIAGTRGIAKKRLPKLIIVLEKYGFKY